MSDVAKAAAHWWATNIGPHAKKDMGPAPEHRGIMNTLNLMSILSAKPISDEERAQFVQFEELLEAAIDRELQHRPTVRLSVDYHPDGILHDAAKTAGLKDGIDFWPWKTTMEVFADRAVVRNGYGAAEEQVDLRETVVFRPEQVAEVEAILIRIAEGGTERLGPWTIGNEDGIAMILGPENTEGDPVSDPGEEATCPM